MSVRSGSSRSSKLRELASSIVEAPVNPDHGLEMQALLIHSTTGSEDEKAET